VKITAVDVTGFGVWTQLKLADLSDRITVFYGANETGKTTLLEFIRAVLYGVPSAGRQRFIPPARQGPAAGALHVDVGGEQLEVRRDFEREIAEGGWLEVVDSDGVSRGRDVLESALRDIDETTFRHVFAIGIRELQELGTLGDQQAAQWLYDLTAGWDRVSLIEATRAAEGSRNRLLDIAGGPCTVADLLDERDRIEKDVIAFGTSIDAWARLSHTAVDLEEKIAELEKQGAQFEREAADVRVALVLKDKWDQRAAIQQQLVGLGNLPVLPASGTARLESCIRRLASHARQREKRRRARRRLRGQIRMLEIDATLAREGRRIEALAEQRDWIRSMEHRIRHREMELADRRSQGDGRKVPPQADGTSDHSDPVALSPRVRHRLRGRARAVRLARKQAAETKRKAEATKTAADEHSSPLRQALLARDVHDLPAAVQNIGQRAAQLRRCMALDERLERLGIHEAELEEQLRGLMHERLLPLWILIATGAMFVLGVAMMLAGVWLPTAFVGASGRWLAVLGVLGTATSGLVKYLMERSVAHRLEDCQKQLVLLRQQVEKAKHERTTLDGVLTAAGGPVAVQLQTAEKDLATLEQLLPSDAKRQNAEREAALASDDARQAGSALERAEVQWRESLAACGLPTHLSPRDILRIAQSGERRIRTENHLEPIQHDLDQYRHDYDMVASRVRHVAASAGMVTADSPASELLERLIHHWTEQKPKHARRRALGRRVRRLRSREARAMQTVRSLVHERDMLLMQAGVSTPAQYHALEAECQRAARLREQFETLNHHIQSTLADHAIADHVKSELAIIASEQLELRQEKLASHQSALQQQLKQCLVQQGAVQQDLERLARDRRPAEKQWEWCIVQQRLNDAVNAWQVHATTSVLLEEVRHDYEQNRQPETLVEASTYLRQMTEGRYTRVWTPVEEDALYLENAQGESLPILVLSRGTREQLFLCLRLALVAHYARRGKCLPLVLDDVLVNFDDSRAKAAARVLRDFAKQGHQLLVFTCHAHVRRMFQSLKTDVRHLPSLTASMPMAPRVTDAPIDSSAPLEDADDDMNHRLAAIANEQLQSVEEPPPYSIQLPHAGHDNVVVIDDTEEEEKVEEESYEEHEPTEFRQLDESDQARVYQYVHFHGNADADHEYRPAYHFVVSENSMSHENEDDDNGDGNDEDEDEDTDDDWVRIGQRVRRRSMVIPEDGVN
jgi:uncharacterized protein YhaN